MTIKVLYYTVGFVAGTVFALNCFSYGGLNNENNTFPNPRI